MATTSLRRWLAVHSWSSLISTIVLLILFISGLPLIFKGELESLLGYGGGAAVAGPAQAASVDEIMLSAQQAFPDKAVHYVVWEKDMPGRVLLNIGDTPTSHFSTNFNVVMDEHTGALVDADPSPLDFFIDLHTTLTMGPFGYTLMGLMALLMIIALISGVVVYAPHMRRLEFGEVRQSSPRLRWLDLHNLIGMVTLGWALVVGGTGMINSWGEYILMGWRNSELSAIEADYQGRAALPTERAPLDQVLHTALAAVKNKELYYIASPGSFMSTPYHYSVYLRGDDPSTEFLLQPVLVDAETGELTASPQVPGYISALMLSQPLHFGNYGGMPLKILWAIFDVLTIILLGSGLYLWWVRRRSPRKTEKEALHVQTV